MLSNTSRYALRAVIYLASKGDDEIRIGIKKIAEDLDIPSPFLGKILQTLAKKKLLLSTKGPNGGFAYPSNAKDVTLYDIITVIDGDELFTRCLLSDKNCGDGKEVCAMHNEYHSIRKEIVKMFKGKTILELAEANKELENIVY